ncbi:MAG TPA: DUF2946 family protein [Rhizomicrobium sp.]|jgi:hypothetical protein
MRRISGRNVRKAGAIALVAPPRRLLLTLFCLLAFSLQSYIAQTHIHVPGTTDPGISAPVSSHTPVSADVKKQSEHKQLPGNDDTSSCPFCQTVLHAGAFLTPSLLVLFLPDTWAIAGAALVVAPHHERAPSHAWHSRGPPRL